MKKVTITSSMRLQRDTTNNFREAVINHVQSYDGVFVFGVPSTMKYCRPSCPVYNRGSEEIVLFRSPDEAESHGYSSCVICSPTDIEEKARKAELVERICNYIRRNLSTDLSLEALGLEFSLNPTSVQKIFKEIMGISPRKYVEECRIVLLKNNLKNGEPIPNAIYNSGYNSQSWLYENSTSKLGMHPSSYRKGGKGTTIHYQTGECQLGRIIVAQTVNGICAVSIADSDEKLLKNLEKEYPNARLVRSDIAKERLESVLSYFDGQLLNLPVDVGGTDFQRRVWTAISAIPYGETRSYNELAEMIGRPKSYRAVANACGANPVPLVIPCHRVVRKNGDLGGYGLGVEKKEFLLGYEKEQVKRARESRKR